MAISNGYEVIKDNVYHSYMTTSVEKKWGRLEEEEVSLFIHFLIESQTFITLIYISEWRVECSAFLALAFISKALEVIEYDSFECVRGNLGKRLSWWCCCFVYPT